VHWRFALFGLQVQQYLHYVPGTVDEQERKSEKAKPGTTEDKIRALQSNKKQISISFDKMQGKGSEIDEQISIH
jgi:hypothetical protein